MTRDEGHDQRPDLERDDASTERYADLLGEDASLAGIVGALDSLYNQGQPPARIDAEIERALSAPAIRPVDVPARSVKGPRTTMPTMPKMPAMPRRMSTLAACAAAVVIVGLMAALLHGFGPGGAGLGSSGRATAAVSDVFARYGGIEVVADLKCPDSAPSCDLAAARSQVIEILVQRLSSTLTNLPELVVRPQGASGIVADIPGAQPAAVVRSMFDAGGFAILDTGTTQLATGSDVSGQTCLTTCNTGQYRIAFTSSDLDPASVQAGLDQQTAHPVIMFAFAGAARARFAQYTGSHVGMYLTIAVDNQVVESASIREQIAGTAEVSGIGTPQQARNLAAFMKFGALPAVLKIVRTQTVPSDSQYAPCVPPTPTPMPFVPGTATPTATAAQTQSAPANVTPGPQATYVQNVTTATAVSSTYAPVNPTSTFPVNSDVYVVATLRNLTAGQTHTLSIHWFLDGKDLQLAASSALSKTISKDTTVYFSLRYPTAGLGGAKLYLDRPINDPDTDTTYLAASVDFTIQMSGAPLPTPTPFGGAGGSGSGGGPTCPTPLPTPAATPTWTPNPSGPTPAPGPTPPPTPTPTPPSTATPSA